MKPVQKSLLLATVMLMTSLIVSNIPLSLSENVLKSLPLAWLIFLPWALGNVPSDCRSGTEEHR